MAMSAERVLVGIPAYNEERTIAGVVSKVRDMLPSADVLVIDDGSRDGTVRALRDMRIAIASHLCNLGYGRAIQTAIKYAQRYDYDALITLDADGQHRPEQVRAMLDALGDWDYLIGSRYVATHRYSDSPLGRRIGMQVFSRITGLVTGRRIYDTTSGFKIIRRRAFEPLTQWHFVDFHAEAIVFLTRLGFRVGEYPITVEPRRHGQSMYNLLSAVIYPLQTLLMVVLGLVQSELTRRRKVA
jgi:glycosyltransferase involved in cell wall biosynthesis